MKRVRLRFVDDIEIDFVDREQALKRVVEWAEKGMINVQVVYGPEGCGKTAWLKQSAELLRELGFDVIYVNPVEREFYAEIGVKDVKNRLLEIVRGATDDAWGRVAWAVIDAAKELIKAGRKKLAILADDVFQAIGLDRAAIYVKGLLGLIEYPPASYERVITVAATSEGVSRREIGRHRWADLRPIWNMSKEGFKQLYDQIPGDKPSFEEIWRITGGNPKALAELYRSSWQADEIANSLIEGKMITREFIARWRGWLERAVEDPDALWEPDAPQELVKELIERNLIIYFLSRREPRAWIDNPPPERDPELGIGRYVAWQTPLHRIAVRKAITEAG
ncbi:MAG: ATP-binding protein [Sulfolobales archaeon]